VDFYSHQREAAFTQNTIIEKQRFLWSSFVEGLQDLYGKLEAGDKR
jgi:hypothetical protein